MRNEILVVALCLFLLVNGVIAISGGEEEKIQEKSLFSNISLPVLNHLEYDHFLEDIGPSESNTMEGEKRERLLASHTQGLYDFLGWAGSNIQEFLGWAGSNIQEFLGWAGSNIQEFLAWAGSNTYEGTAALGKGGIILLLVILLIVISYGAVMF